MPEPSRRPWFATITTSRYLGIYERGPWVCFRAFHEDLPSDAFDDDLTAQEWWNNGEEEAWVGRGDTPQQAFEDMVRRWDRMGCPTCRGTGLVMQSGDPAEGKPILTLLTDEGTWTSCPTCEGAGRGPRRLAP